jgi:MFS family permease
VRKGQDEGYEVGDAVTILGLESEEPSAVLRHRRFAKFWGARILTTSAFQMQNVAIGWVLYSMTGRALDLGLLGLAQFLPVALFSLIAGHFADRHDRRAIVALCQSVSAAIAMLLAVGLFTGTLGRQGIFLLAALSGTARAFEFPTMSALMPNLVPAALLAKASAWSASAGQSALIAGPFIGGILLAVDPVAAFGTASGMYLCAATLSWSIGEARSSEAREPITLKSFFSGIAFVFAKPVILGTLSLDLFAVLLGGVTALLPIFAQDILQCGPWGLGLLRSAPAGGALAMSILLAQRPLKNHIGRRMFAAVLIFGLATIVFGLSANLYLSLTALVVLGAADVVSVVIRFSLVQIQTPDAMRGRVSALNAVFIGASNQLGDFESGAVAALFGAVPAVMIGGAGTILIALLWMVLFPDLRRLRSFEG